MPGPLMLDIAGLELDNEDRELLQHPLVGGVILFSRNYKNRLQLSELNKEIRSVRSPELLIAVDQEGGRVQRFRSDFTELPPLRWLGRLYDINASHGRQMALLVSRLMATELLDAGVDFSFAPVVDLDRGLCPVIGDRALHPSPEATAALGLACMQGMRQAGMAAVAKHFPGHGAVAGDSHHTLPEDTREAAELEDDIRPYRSLIDDGLRGIMMAHIRYPSADSRVASLSPYWMNTVLRQQLGFAGAIFSDDLSMAGARIGGDLPSRAVAALEAGADMILVCNDRAAIGPVLDAIRRYRNPAASGRLAAMRAARSKYLAAPYRSPEWKSMRTRLLDALEPPPLELDGQG